ncbi:MAG: uroporphyrinogen decarboxylase family protein [Candidatus Hodarchaeota archaeon]
MNARERVLKALENSGEPDRIPSFAQGMMGYFQQKAVEMYDDDIQEEDVTLVNGDWTLFKFFKFDSFWVHGNPIRYKPLNGINTNNIEIEDNGRVTRMGHIHRFTSEGSAKYQSGYLNSKELWNDWIDAGYFDIDFDEDWVRRWEKGYKELLDVDLMSIPVTTCFEPIREAFSFGRFSYFYRKHMDFLKKLADLVTKNLMEVAKGWCDSGFEIVSWADDCAYKNRVMFSPKVFEELVEPIYKKLNDYCHKRGVMTFFHSDGFTEPFFDGLIRSGFNGIESLEPAAGMDLAHLKEEYGSRVCLIGNVDCSRLLPYGTEQEVMETVKNCIRDAGPDGGYILSPPTDIIDSCNPRNIKTMIDTLHKYGKYPLEL